MATRKPPPPPGPPPPRRALTPASAITGDGLLAAHFLGPSWDRWRAVLKAAYGEPLTPAEAALFREVAERDPPTRQVGELWCVVGRRGGKDSVASGIATIAALGDYSDRLRPGERASVMCLASTRDQATIVFRYILGYFTEIPLLKALVLRASDDTIELANGAEIIVSTNSFRAVRGRSVVVAILDEVAYFRSDELANPDSELYNALLPAMATFPNALLIGISSPYRRKGLLFDKWRKAYGQNDPDVLVVRGASRVFNETLRQKLVDDRLAADPEAGAAEYLAEWRNDLSDFLDRELVESAVDQGVRVRPPHPLYESRCFIDASGGRGDSFAAAIAHAEGSVSVLDSLYERRAPFDPYQVVAEVADLLRSYGISRVSGDRYAANWVTEAFAKEGISYENSERDRSAIYLDVLPLFTSGRIRLLDSARLIYQFVGLERQVGRFGKDKVNHADGGSDDLCNAAAGAAVLVASDLRPALVEQRHLLDERGAPLPLPKQCAAVFAYLACDKKGVVAVIFSAISRVVSLLQDGTFGHAVFVLDYRCAPIWPTLFADVRQQLLALGEQVGVLKDRWGTLAAFVYVDPKLARQAAVAGLPAEQIPDHLTVKSDELFLAASMHIQRGMVRLCQPAHERAKTSPFGGALDFRGGDKEDDPLRRAALWMIALSLDTQ